MKKWISLLFLIIVITITYFSGNKPMASIYTDDLPRAIGTAAQIEKTILNLEKVQPVKADNHSRIFWNNDSLKEKTPICVLYLHGFSASHKEGDPLHKMFAKRYGANLYIPRLSEHGLQSDSALYYYHSEKAWENAKWAYAVAKELGDEVIIMGTSTGATLGLMLAARFPLKALINISPNIRINDPFAFLLNNPWGLQIARLVLGGEYRTYEANDSTKMYWDTHYRIESLVQLQQLLEDNMHEETFKKITIPVFTGCYYKNENEQDPIVSVAEMRNMHRLLASSENQKLFVEFPNAGDHVLGSSIKSKDIESVSKAIFDFSENVLGLVPLQ